MTWVWTTNGRITDAIASFHTKTNTLPTLQDKLTNLSASSEAQPLVFTSSKLEVVSAFAVFTLSAWMSSSSSSGSSGFGRYSLLLGEILRENKITLKWNSHCTTIIRRIWLQWFNSFSLFYKNINDYLMTYKILLDSNNSLK